MMRNLFAMLLLCAAMHAQIATTRIVDTVSGADGASLNGTLQIEPMRLEHSARTVIPRPLTVRIAGGRIDLRLVPNAGSRPNGTSYRVTYKPDGGQRGWSEYWVVPTSTVPVTVAQVWVAARPALETSGGGTAGCSDSYSDVEVPGGIIDGQNAAFTLAASPMSSKGLLLYRNGLLQMMGNGGDYDLSGNLITFRPPSIPQAGDILQAVYRVAGSGATQ